MITRRRFLHALGGGALISAALGGYAFAVEPLYRLRLQHYRIQPDAWGDGPPLRIAVLADLHACEPWMNVPRITEIVTRTNALNPDLILLLGDFAAGMRLVLSIMHPNDWSDALKPLSAPLGVYAIQGNHDWWEDRSAQINRSGPTFVQEALERIDIPVLENDALRLEQSGQPFWLAGLGDQLAFLPRGKFDRTKTEGVHDLDGTLAKVTDDAPVILMAHEPDIFPQVPDRVALTLSGHTHGGQVRFFGYAPVVPSSFGNRYAYGHIVEDNRHLIVSAGLGCSILPVRFGSPPEIVLIELGGPAA